MQSALISKPLVARPAVGRHAQSRRTVTVFAADRPTWYPGAKPPKYLDGSIAGYEHALCTALGCSKILQTLSRFHGADAHAIHPQPPQGLRL